MKLGLSGEGWEFSARNEFNYNRSIHGFLQNTNMN